MARFVPPIVKKSYTKIIGNPLDNIRKVCFNSIRKEGKQMTEKQFRQIQKLIKIRQPFIDAAAAAAKAGDRDLVKKIYADMRQAQINAQR